MERAYYSGSVSEFLGTSKAEIMDSLRGNDLFEPDRKQDLAWKAQIAILQKQLRGLGSGHIMFEYTIPRMGKRVDAVLLHSDFVFVMEFKVNKRAHQRQDELQCVDYALDLKNFHEKSHCASIVPVLVSTDAESEEATLIKCDDGVYNIVRTNKDGISEIVEKTRGLNPGCDVDAPTWETSAYKPTPTITEAAMALCSNISELDQITRSDEDAPNLGPTTDTLANIMAESRRRGSKSLCFVTGVPGSGKTLAALNLVCSRQGEPDERALMLSGNETLVTVLQESLKNGGACLKKYDGAAAAALVQHIPKFRSTITEGEPPVERIVVFDEAQRAWSAEKLSRSARGKRTTDPRASDPELLIRAMDKHDGWAVIVCLIGQGQEIHDGEVGAAGWLDAVRDRPGWRVYHPENVSDRTRLGEAAGRLGPGRHDARPDLHLGASIRSFRAESFAKMVGEILDCNPEAARRTWVDLRGDYPIAVTRDIEKARRWLRAQARGSERYGIVASSGADRLRPHGIYVRSPIKPKQWFLADSDDIRSSYRLEDVATEFYVQGLELDWTCLAWDANLRYADGAWSHHVFHGNDWRRIRQEKERVHLVNAYRVLMTRARQGMVIFVPEGDADNGRYGGDPTRKPEFYDGTYEYLASIGFDKL